MVRWSSESVGELGRVLFGCTYLGGAVIHLYLWGTNRAVYAEMTQFILFDWYRGLWTRLVLPNLDVLLPTLALAEFGLGLAILGRGRSTRNGLFAGALFNLGLAPLGYWWPANVLLAAGQLTLARVRFRESAIRFVRASIRRGITDR